MNPKAIIKARSRLVLAQKQLELAEKSSIYRDFSDNWYLFLVAAKNIYTTLEQGSKSTPQSRQWFGARKKERKADPLLQYLFQARNDDEHGIEPNTEFHPGKLQVGNDVEGYSQNMMISIDATGSDIDVKASSLDGLPIHVENRDPEIKLKTVVDDYQ